MQIFLLNQTTLEGEWMSLLGDKYREALPFSWTFTDNFQEAQVVAWDGLLTPKLKGELKQVIESLKNGQKILLLQREALTLFEEQSFIEYLDLDQVRYVELQSMNVLPEDLILALESCHRKLAHV